MKRLALVTCLFLLLAGCVKETSWPVGQPAPQRIVADAILTDQVGTQHVRLTYPVSQLNQAPQPVTGAGVVVSNEDSVWTLTENPASAGNYLVPATFTARPGKNYTLQISLGNTVYSAKSAMVAGSYFPELRYALNSSNGMYYVDWVASAFSTKDAAMWELLIDWSKVPGYQQLDSLQNHARMLFYTLPTLDVSEVFAPQMESIYFPAGTVISERRYSVTPEHAEFLRELMLETNWTGGLFNVASANVTTNLSNGAIGFFGVCAVTELSVTVNP
jgi:hypothetical protein